MNVSIDLPNDVDGIGLAGTQTIKIGVSPAPLRVEVFVDDHMLPGGPVYAPPWQLPWDTTKFSNGTHVLRAEAVYSKRRSKTQVAVTVKNAAQPAPSGRSYGGGQYGDGTYGGNA